MSRATRRTSRTRYERQPRHTGNTVTAKSRFKSSSSRSSAVPTESPVKGSCGRWASDRNAGRHHPHGFGHECGKGRVMRMGCGVSVQCDCDLCRASRPVELLVVEQVPMPSSVGALIECRYCHGALPTVRMRGIVPDGEG